MAAVVPDALHAAEVQPQHCRLTQKSTKLVMINSTRYSRNREEEIGECRGDMKCAIAIELCVRYLRRPSWLS